MEKMTMIITMAGLGQRFRDAGYDCPKYMIEAKGKTLFEWSMDSLIDYNSHVAKYIFVVRKEDNAQDFIMEKSRSYGDYEVQVVELNHTTDGQATTCLEALEYCGAEMPIMIYNIDTYVEPYEMKFSDISGDGHIPCFQAQGDHWSFVKVDEKGQVVEVREKERISDNCTLGAYYFSSANLYKKIYHEYYMDNTHLAKGEKYIAPLYDFMVKKNMDVTISMVDARKVHVLGTPEELDAFINL